MRKWIIALSLVAVAWGGQEVYAQHRLRQLMADKLQASQRLLEGLALGDFKKIATQADNLVQLAGQAEWIAYKTNRYEQRSNEFRRAAELIAQKAKEKNLEGATLAYLDLTWSCVRCHEYVREVRDARRPAPPDAIVQVPLPADARP
jgi:hypothetical protein